MPCISSKASCRTSTKWFLTPSLTTACHAYAVSISHLHPGKETGMRAASSGCPTSWHPGRAASVQPPAWLSLGGSEYILLLSHWLPEERLWRGRGKKEGNEPERPLQAFCILRKHPELTPERLSPLLNSCSASCKNCFRCHRTLLL